MSQKVARDFDPAFKLKVVARIEGGTNVSALSRELGIKRTLLYRWRDAWKKGGPEALRRHGRPRKTARLLVPESAAESVAAVPVGPSGVTPSALETTLTTAEAPVLSGAAAELAEARGHILALEQKIGQQQMELDFFRQALRHFKTLQWTIPPSGATASTPSSRR